MNSPIYSLDVAAWFKSTFSQDRNGKIILSYPSHVSATMSIVPSNTLYGIPDIIKNINNNDYYAILDHIEKACKQGNWVYSGPNVRNEIFYLRINYVSAKAELYMNSIYDTTDLEEFLKPVASMAKMFELLIPKSEFIKYIPENNWYYNFNKYGDQKMYLAWENECLRKRVEDLEVKLRTVIDKLN
tara:strand:- start:87 stop:644 length:558 start_codon:yes stop_codon:yes gene_type:complete